MTGTSIRGLWATVIVALAVLWGAAASADALPPAVGKPHLAIRLVAESEHPRAGSTLTVALATVPEAGWHGYWRNPGDAGFAGDYKWTLPAGAIAGAVQWPVPTTLVVAGLMNYVYEAPYAPLVDIAVPAGLAAGIGLPPGAGLVAITSRSPSRSRACCASAPVRGWRCERHRVRWRALGGRAATARGRPR